MRSAVLALLALPLLAADFRAGRGAVKITPPKGAPMAGYYYVRLNEGVHDELWSKAIVLESGGRKAALVALDLVSIPRPFVEQARELIGKQTGIPGAAVMISATHSHTGPEMGGRLKGVDAATERLAKDYHAALPGLIAESVKLADADLRPARIKAAAGREESISFIRRFFMTDGSTGWNPGKLNPRIVRPAGEIDPSVPLGVFETGQPEPKPAAAYVNFANHLWNSRSGEAVRSRPRYR